MHQNPSIKSIIHTFNPSVNPSCGRILHKHVQSIEANPDLQIVAVCDEVEAKAQAAGSQTGAVAYTDARQMLEAEKLDIATVLTHSGDHFRTGMLAAPLVDTLVVEKPLTLTLEHADTLVEACDRHNTRLFVVKQNRYNPPVVRAHEALEAGRFGKLVLGTVRVRWCRPQAYYDRDAWRGTWKDDGGVLTNQASHHIDLLRWFMGPVESVKAYTTRRMVDIETEDTGVAVLRFTSGALGVVEATTATRPRDLEGSLSIMGETGSVVIAGFAVNEMQTWNFADEQAEDASVFDSSTNPDNVYGFGHQVFYRDVVECIRTGRRAMLSGLEGRKSLELITAIYESAASGREVRLRYVPQGVPLGQG